VSDLLRLPITTTGTRDLMPRAWGLRGTITPYDACYAALAEVLHAPFVTADRRLVRSLHTARTGALYLGALS
jgi:predicted nucleic acid-binding protein